ncbi:unnamed protein product [Schistosoma mattheei]|uniref:Uncharacterized protein n=1 Tax=Schistosoma mattheei TaxID=31246 RepID=A0A183NMM8_9TREM|nr:unnamed protein product [Schistosoma mattheei]
MKAYFNRLFSVLHNLMTYSHVYFLSLFVKTTFQDGVDTASGSDNDANGENDSESDSITE